jgi:hypothetical protein
MLTYADVVGRLWLIEFNYKPGMRAARGVCGDMKRRLVTRFCADEAALQLARAGGAAGGEERAFGFRRLAVSGWPCSLRPHTPAA